MAHESGPLALVHGECDYGAGGDRELTPTRGRAGSASDGESPVSGHSCLNRKYPGPLPTGFSFSLILI